MILGMSTSTFTLVHVVLSLVGIFAGLVVVFGMFGSKKLDGWTALFLATTVLTSVTGFFFPFDKILPSHIVGIISLVVLAIAILALYALHLAVDLRGKRSAGSLFECLRGSRPGVPEAPAFGVAGADTIRAAIPDRAGRRAGDIRRAWHRGRTIVSPSGRRTGLKRGLISIHLSQARGSSAFGICNT
jgi:hypothetical protein